MKLRPLCNNDRDEMTCCRNCGGTVAAWAAVKAAIQEEFSFTDDELESADIAIFHPDCAVADERIAAIEDLDGAAFYWEVRSPGH